MATAQTIINSALRKLGVIGVGQSPDATESGDCLTTLNEMIASWQNERLLVYTVVPQTKAISAGASSVTVGSAGSWAIDRPLKLEWLDWYDGANYFPITLHPDANEYQRLTAVSVAGQPTEAHYRAAYPTATLLFWPTASAGGTLSAGVWTTLTTLSTLATSVSLPPGYELALSTNLAVLLSSEYQVDPKAALVESARESKAAIKRTNYVTPVLRVDSGLPGADCGAGSIISGV